MKVKELLRAIAVADPEADVVVFVVTQQGPMPHMRAWHAGVDVVSIRDSSSFHTETAEMFVIEAAAKEIM